MSLLVIFILLSFPPPYWGGVGGEAVFSDYFAFPASGYRNRETGGLNSNLGKEGYCWSSSSRSAESVNGSNLGFNSTVVNPLNNNSRPNGFPVRCVQAFTEIINKIVAASFSFFPYWGRERRRACLVTTTVSPPRAYVGVSTER